MPESQITVEALIMLFVTVILIIILARVQHLNPIGRIVHFPAAHAQLLPLVTSEETLPAGCAVQIAIVSTLETEQLRALRSEIGLVIRVKLEATC